MADRREREGETKESEPPLLFPLFPVASATNSQSQWLSNSSFTTDLSVINDAVSSHRIDSDSEDEADGERGETKAPPPPLYRPVESSPSSESGEERKRKRRRKGKSKKTKRYGRGSDERGLGLGGYSSKVVSNKDYFFDSRGDLDNLAFGSLYRMDVARYKAIVPGESSGIDFRRLSRWKRTSSILDRDGDVEALDNKLKSGGRYWSVKYMAMESQKNLKRLRIIVPQRLPETVSDDFIALSDLQTSMVEESWEDEVLRKTREFNKMTRERPNDEKAWMEFAEFQDKVASMQSHKGARLQTLEKKISVLEKATELNPDSEELLLCLLKAYRRRDSTDVLIGRWEKILLQNSGNRRIWKEFLGFLQGEFSNFKVSEMRKMYSTAIQALSASCSRHSRQAHESTSSTPDSTLAELELGLVDIFLSLCRFEWQTGYQELATGLFQAEIEYSLFCPSLSLTEQSKQRLFEHFWDSDGARVGEEGGSGWSTWLAKEEENRQRILKEEALADEVQGGWTGWSEPFSKNNANEGNTDTKMNSNVEGDELQPGLEDEDVEEEDDAEALLKKLGIDVDAASNDEIKDASTWIRWSKEELSRDREQWMPVREKSRAGVLTPNDIPEAEEDEHLSRVIMYEDVNEFLFSLSSFEARLSLVSQFVEFFGGKIPQWICSNNPSWIEKSRSMEELPESLLKILRKVHDLSKLQNYPKNLSLEFLLEGTNETDKRTEMMKFLRNATLACLTVFPRNHIMEEAVLVAEELSGTKMDTETCQVTPCRTLAKRLLKADRQDILLCGVYARREASYGNVEHARRVFDMALSSIEGLPLVLKSVAPLLYFWYAEAELANDPSKSSESSLRVMHILSCLGSGETYSPFRGRPSSTQLLRAHQGFKEKIKAVRSSWVHGVIDDQSVSVVCSAALFEELSSGWTAGIQVLDQAFAMVLPERRSRTYQIEFLFEFSVRMLQRHLNQLSQMKCWESISEGLQVFPFNAELCSALVQTGHLYTTSNKLRRLFDEYCQKKQSVIMWVFAISFEMSRGGCPHRICGLFERALGNYEMRNSVLLWRSYIAFEANVACNPSAAKRVFFRAIHACPWSKKLWMDGFTKLNSILSPKELSDLQEVMRDKELNLRTDMYEILLQDEIAL